MTTFYPIIVHIGNNDLSADSGNTSLAYKPSTMELNVGGDITALASDKRLKKNISTIENPLEKLNKLSGFTYTWNEEVCEKVGFKQDYGKEEVGVFAQDIQEVLPQAVRAAPFDVDNDGNSISGEDYLTVKYEKVVPFLIECIKEQQETISELKEKVTNKDEKYEQLQERMKKLEEFIFKSKQ